MNLLKFIYIGFISLFGPLFVFGSCSNEAAEIHFVPEYISFKQVAELPLHNLPKMEAWQKAVPKVVEISIPRNNNEPDQPALWYHSGTKTKKPLFLVLHSWSADYLQHYGIPYGAFAEKNDWIFIHPNYRGKFDNPEATGSEKAIQDVLAALEYAKEHAPVDNDRIYLAGFSGGAMMSLILAGRYPEKFTAALVWVPVYDLNDWYDTVIQSQYNYTAYYRNDIEVSCGGKPDKDDKAMEECRKRSPSAYLANARGKGVQVFISGGIQDHFVPPSHAIRAFNDLADDKDKISETDYKALDETKSLSDGLKGYEENNRFFDEAELPVIFKRKSGNATIVLFDGGHDIVYNAGFHWLSELHR